MKEFTGADILRVFGQNLRRIRTRKKISQLGLAAKTSLTHNFINEIENGRKWISSNTLARLSSVLKTDPFQFFLSDPPEMVRTDILDGYLDNLSDSFFRMVADLRENYLTSEEDPDGKE